MTNTLAYCTAVKNVVAQTPGCLGESRGAKKTETNIFVFHFSPHWIKQRKQSSSGVNITQLFTPVIYNVRKMLDCLPLASLSSLVRDKAKSRNYNFYSRNLLIFVIG